MHTNHDDLHEWIRRWWPGDHVSSQDERETFARAILHEERSRMTQIIEDMKIAHVAARNSVLDEVLHRLTTL